MSSNMKYEMINPTNKDMKHIKERTAPKTKIGLVCALS